MAGQHVLLVAPPLSYRIPAYIDAARRIGVGITVASDGRHSLVSEVARGVRVTLDQPGALAKLQEAARREPFSAVVATDDAAVELASALAESLGLPHNSPESTRITRRKDLARQTLLDAGLPVPAFRRVDLRRSIGPQLHGIDFPCVVKPLALSASRGVIRADDAAALESACQRVGGILRQAAKGEEREAVLVERFIPGFEVALEGMLYRGRLRVLALFDKPDPLNGPYFEETYYVTPSRLPAGLQGAIAARVAEACAAFGLTEGPIHAELRVQSDKIFVLEVAARTIGGQCARLLRFGTGRGLEETVLLHAMGRNTAPVRMSGGAGVLMIPTPRAGILRRVEGVLAARSVPYIEDVEISIREGYELVPLPEGGAYLGFIFARGSGAAEAEAALREAHACLRVVTAPVIGRQVIS